MASAGGNANDPPLPSCPEAARKQEKGRDLAKLPFCGTLTQKANTTPFIMKHFLGETSFENILHVGDSGSSSMYRALVGLNIRCKHCKSKVKGVGVEEDSVQLKKFNPTNLVDHLAKCKGIDKFGEEFEEMCNSPNLRSQAWQEARQELESRKRKRMEDAQQHAGHGQQTEREIVLQERERKRLSSEALKANDDRQRLLDQYIALDPPVPDAQFDLIMWTLSVFCFMCRISFAVFDNIWFRKVSHL